MTPEMARLMINTQAQANLTYLKSMVEDLAKLLQTIDEDPSKQTVEVTGGMLDDWRITAQHVRSSIEALIQDQRGLVDELNEASAGIERLSYEIDKLEGKA